MNRFLLRIFGSKNLFLFELFSLNFGLFELQTVLAAQPLLQGLLGGVQPPGDEEPLPILAPHLLAAITTVRGNHHGRRGEGGGAGGGPPEGALLQGGRGEEEEAGGGVGGGGGGGEGAPDVLHPPPGGPPGRDLAHRGPHPRPRPPHAAPGVRAGGRRDRGRGWGPR